MVNEEISELSDSIKLLESDVSNIENSERNSAKNLKSSAGEFGWEGLLSKLNKIFQSVVECFLRYWNERVAIISFLCFTCCP